MYVCKASSDIGMAVTKARLRIIGPGEVEEEVVEKKVKRQRKPKQAVQKVEEAQRFVSSYLFIVNFFVIIFQ